MTEIEKLIKVAGGEVGYLEKSKSAYNSNPNIIYNKTKGAGKDNITKYAKEMDDLKVYNTKKQGYAWCNIFIDWCFVEAFGQDRAKELLLGWSAGVTQDYNWFKEYNQIHSNAKVGDLVIFGDCDHIGIVVDVDSSKIYTIEGNTSGTTGLVANGGQVAKKSYSKSSSYIKCYARPNYQIQYRSHCQLVGWQKYVNEGEISGTTGKGRRLEAIQIDSDEIQYRVHMQLLGWGKWCTNNEVAGTTGEKRRVEAIEFKSNREMVAQAHCQLLGWQEEQKGKHIVIGTTGQRRRLEAFILKFK